MESHEKGLIYEKYVKNFIIQNLCKNAYLWNECPENILIDNNLIHSHNDMRLLRKDIKEGHLHTHKDIGIDIVQIEHDKCSIVQCKNGYDTGLRVDDIAGIMMRCAFIRDVNTFIYYTNCLSRNILYTSSISPYVVNIEAKELLLEVTEVTEVTDVKEVTKFKKIKKFTNDNKIYFVKLPYENDSKSINDVIKTSISPYSYQTEAAYKFKEYFETNNRGILSLPCGCGKTYVSYLITIDYKHIIILSPLREFASQNLNRFIEYGYNKENSLLVDTDGSRDIDAIKKFIKKRSNSNALISCTYKSMDIISKCLDIFKDALFIIDEFHNLSKANISEPDNDIYKLLISNHKILFMSATPRIYDIEEDNTDYSDMFDIDNLFGEIVYKMSFTDAISNKYITDYKIWLPSISEDMETIDKELSIYKIDNQMKNRCKYLYSCLLNNGSRKCIVYCKDTNDMTNMMESMKILNDFYIMNVNILSISCEDNETKRKNTLELFSNNNEYLQLLFSIKILNECIDIPACDSIYISYAPKNKITTIQRISRAIRTDNVNPYKIANIYIWCDSYEEILDTLSSIKEYDIMFTDKIKINAVDFYHSNREKDIELIKKENELLTNYIIGIKEFKQYTWSEKLKIVEEYIINEGKLPSQIDKNKDIKSLGQWVSNQKTNYSKKVEIMKNEDIRKQWEDFKEKYKEVFRTFEEIWKDNLNKVEEYIINEGKLPSNSDKNKDIKSLGLWVSTQKTNYSKKKYNMKNEDIRKQWEDFTEKYKELFKTGQEIWKDNLKKLEEYIINKCKTPSEDDKNKDIKIMGKWFSHQKTNYSKKEQIMKNEDIRKIWEDFVEKYKELFRTIEVKIYKFVFRTFEEIWKHNLKKLEEYIINDSKLPSTFDKNKDIKSLARWVCTQKKNYSKKVEIMKNEDIRKQWEDFTEKYKELFKTWQEIWNDNLKKFEEYIINECKLPSVNDKNKDIKSLGKWCSHQKTNYSKKVEIMKDEYIRKIWEDFTEKYKELFKTNKEIWNDNLKKFEEYIINECKLPSQNDKNKDIKSLAAWVYNQKRNYSKKENIMKDEDIRKQWEDFTEKYKELF